MTLLGTIHNAIDKIFSSSTTQAVQEAATNTSVPNSINESEQSGKQAVIDTFELSGSDFEKYCKRHKLNETELSDYVRGTFNHDDKINSSPDDIKKAKYCLEAAYKYLANGDNNVDIKELKDLAEQYFIAINTGWNIKEFQEEQGKVFKINHSVSSAYKKFCLTKFKFGKLFADDITADKEFFKEYIKDSMVNIDDEAIKSLKSKGNNNPTSDDILAEKKQLQIKIFGRMLANTKDEDRPLLMKAIKELYKENRVSASNTTYSACEDKAKVAHFALEDRHEIYDGLSDNETTQLQELNYHYANQDDVTHYSQEDINIAKSYFTENNINPDELRAKLAAGAVLSPEEQSASHYLSMLSGAQLGISGNVVMEPTEQMRALSAYNQNLSEKDLYSSVTKNSADYINQNSNTTLTTAEKFCKTMNKTKPANVPELVINEEGQIIVTNSSDIKQTTNFETGKNTEKKVITQQTNTQSLNSEGHDAQRFMSKETKNITNPLADKPRISNSEYKEKTFRKTIPFSSEACSTKTEAKKKESNKTMAELVEEYGSKTDAIVNILDNKVYKADLQNEAIELCLKAADEEKCEILSKVPFDAFVMLIEQMSQKERIELVQEGSKLDPTRIELIKNKFIWDIELYNKSNLSSSAI